MQKSGLASENNKTMEQMEQETKEMTSLNYINKSNAVFKETQGGFLSLDFMDKHYDRIQVIRLFPFTDRDKFISIRTVDERSKEIGIIKELKDVEKSTQKMLLKQLDLHYFTPLIEKIIDIKDEYGYAYFHVITDRGECRFSINMGGNAVVRLSESRLLITDLDENRFEIRDVFKLTDKEQRKLDLFL